MLTQALAWWQEQQCPCGCGQLREDCRDPAKAGRWQVVMEDAHAGAALRDFQHNHPDLPAGTLLGVRLLPEGQTPTDPYEFDATRAAAAYAELQQRLGLT